MNVIQWIEMENRNKNCVGFFHSDKSYYLSWVFVAREYSVSNFASVLRYEFPIKPANGQYKLFTWIKFTYSRGTLCVWAFYVSCAFQIRFTEL